MKKAAILLFILMTLIPSALCLAAVCPAEDTVFDEAVKLYAEGKYEDAIKMTEEYAEDYPDPSAYYLIGYALYNLGKHEEADEYFKSAYLIDPVYSPKELLKKIEALKPVKKPPVVKKPVKKAKKAVAAPAAPLSQAPKSPQAKAEAVKPAPAVPAAVAPVADAMAVANVPAVANAPAAVANIVQPAVEKPAVPEPVSPPITDRLITDRLAGLIAGLGIVFIAIPLALYFIVSLCLFLIAKKLGTRAPWTAFVPIAQLWAIAGSAGKPWWWALLLLLPVLNIALFIYLWILIAERLGKKRLLGILMIVPGVNLILLVLFALAKVEKENVAMTRLSEFEEPEEPGASQEKPDEFPGFGEEDFGFGEGPSKSEETMRMPEPPQFPETEKTEFGGFDTPESQEKEAFGQPEEAFGSFGLSEPSTEQAMPDFPPDFSETSASAESGEMGDFPEMPDFPETPDFPESGPVGDIGGFPETSEPSADPFGEFKDASLDIPSSQGEEFAPTTDFGDIDFEAGREPEGAEKTVSMTSGDFEDFMTPAAPEGAGEDAEAAFLNEADFGEPSAPPFAESSESGEAPPSRAYLSGIGDLFKETWGIYKNRLLSLLTIMALSGVIAVIPAGIFFGAGYLLSTLLPAFKDGLLVGGGVVAVVAATIGVMWGQGAFIYAVSYPETDIKQAFGRAWQKLGSFIWVSTLTAFIVMGGFLLFLVPGALFAVWFAFALFVFAKEEERGMNALLKSKLYVSGLWFDVFIRLAVLWVVSAVLGMVPLVGPILSLLFMPFMMIFIYLLYEELRSMKGEVGFAPSSGQKAKFIGLGLLGYILIPLIIIALLGAAITAPLLLMMSKLKVSIIGTISAS